MTPGYELLILGSYPNSRFFSVTVYDSHAAVTSNTIDTEILPLNSSMFNPFLTSAPYQPNQQYGITVGFGGAPLGAVAPGCGTSVTTIDSNFLDASQTHPGITWNGYPDLPAGYLFAPLSSSLVESIAKGQEFIRLQFPLPTYPNTPCKRGGCGLTGLEQVRYTSISFEDAKTTTYASVEDADMVQDAFGNVTLIIGMGTQPPSYVTAANGCTYFDLSQVSGCKNLANNRDPEYTPQRQL